jgi:acetate kinase
MPKAVLAINAGCSTIKFGLFEIQAARLVLLSKGLLEESGPATNFTARGHQQTCYSNVPSRQSVQPFR